MVAAHINDLRAAAKQGMKTVYVNRPEEDFRGIGEVKTKKEGGEVDVVVNSFLELAAVLTGSPESVTVDLGHSHTSASIPRVSLVSPFIVW